MSPGGFAPAIPASERPQIDPFNGAANGIGSLSISNLKYLKVKRRSQWPRGLRRMSAAARLLRLWVRIPPEPGYLSVVSVVCCQVEVSATSWSLVQRSPTDCGATLGVI